jgi:ribonuclease P protein component
VKKEGFPKSIRVNKASEFRQIIESGTKRAGDNLIVFRLQSDHHRGQRFGIRIPPGIRNAVQRNRIKRTIREALRKNKGRLARNESVLVVCRSSALVVGADKLKEDLERLLT